MRYVKRDDFVVDKVGIASVGVRYFVRRHPRIFGLRMPWTVTVTNPDFGGIPMFFSEKQVNRTIARICGED